MLDRIIFSHIPVHPGSKGRFKANIHGHTHSNNVMMDSYWFKLGNFKLGKQVKDPFYTCVSVEQIDYTPINYQEILKRL